MSNIKQLSARRVLSRIICKSPRYWPPIHCDHAPPPPPSPSPCTDTLLRFLVSLWEHLHFGCLRLSRPKMVPQRSHYRHRNPLWKIYSPTRTLTTFALFHFTSCPTQIQRPTTKRHQRWRIPPHLPISQHIYIIWWSANETVSHPGSSPNASTRAP